MKSSISQQNKLAWEQAFDHRLPGWGDGNADRLRSESLPFFCPDLAQELRALDLKGKAVAQFCCNNGRELLSLMGLGPAQGVGFDIAENIIRQAEDTARQAGIRNCQFVACDILALPAAYHRCFDLVLFTIGALTWFEDLAPLFAKVAACLKPGGLVLVHDYHPVINMLPTPDEPTFDGDHLDRVAYSYFRREPWVETQGMAYLSEQYESLPFTSFSHTLSAILNAVSGAGLCLRKFNEYDYDVGLTPVYDGKGVPLSYLLLAQKPAYTQV